MIMENNTWTCLNGNSSVMQCPHYRLLCVIGTQLSIHFQVWLTILTSFPVDFTVDFG